MRPPSTSSHAEESRSERDVLGALEALRPELLRFVKARSRSLSEAEDIVQLSLLRAIEKLDTLGDVSKLRAWVYMIARRNIIDQGRKSQRERLTSFETLPEGDDAQNWPHNPLADEEHSCACAMDLTNSLPPGQAELIRLVDVEENSLQEAAQHTSTTKNAATVRLHRARRNLKEKLRQHCGVLDVRSASRCSCDSSQCDASLEQQYLVQSQSRM